MKQSSKDALMAVALPQASWHGDSQNCVQNTQRSEGEGLLRHSVGRALSVAINACTNFC